MFRKILLLKVDDDERRLLRIYFNKKLVHILYFMIFYVPTCLIFLISFCTSRSINTLIRLEINLFQWKELIFNFESNQFIPME